jgi:hypothetical protein
MAAQYRLTSRVRRVPFEQFGMKYSAGGSHISRIMMLAELDAVPIGSTTDIYDEAILH